MKIEFSDHAIVQLVNRPRIKRDMVIEAIQLPDRATVSYRNRTLYHKSFKGETLEVVTVSEDDTIIVITQYFLDKS